MATPCAAGGAFQSRKSDAVDGCSPRGPADYESHVMPPAGRPPRESVAKSLGLTDGGVSDTGEFFAKQNKKLQEENDKLEKTFNSKKAANFERKNMITSLEQVNRI